jgi:SpoVK/Ycf46/Vps4 family AAA+-type ATPase
VLSSFLTELDGLKTKSDPRYILTIAATNAPRLLDRAILSRFQRKVLIPLPDPVARTSILNIHLRKAGIRSDLPLEKIASETQWYSGRELDAMVRYATNSMIMEENPNISALVDQGKKAIGDYTLKVRTLTERDWQRARENIKPRMNGALYQEFLDFEREQM